MKKTLVLLFFILVFKTTYSQNFGEFPQIAKDKLQRDLDLLYQG